MALPFFMVAGLIFIAKSSFDALIRIAFKTVKITIYLFNDMRYYKSIADYIIYAEYRMRIGYFIANLIKVFPKSER